jgi:hypothetical protein
VIWVPFLAANLNPFFEAILILFIFSVAELEVLFKCCEYFSILSFHLMESEDKMNSVKEQENREEDKPKQTICCICREEKEKVS